MRSRFFRGSVRPLRHSGIGWLFPGRGNGRRAGSRVRRRARWTAAGRQAGIGMERLEGRTLLAITIASNVTLDGDISYTDGESITINPGVVLTSKTGTISLDAPSITLGNAAGLHAAGAVKLTATKTYPNFPFSIWGTEFTVIQAIEGTRANVTIGDDVSIGGASLSISTKAGDESVTESIPVAGKIVDYVGERIGELVGLPFSVQIKQPVSSVVIGSGTRIVTSGDVAIATNATANATGQAIWSALVDAGLGFGIAAGFSYTDAEATARLVGSTRIDSGGKVAITSNVQSAAGMESRVALNQGLQQTDPRNVEVAYAGAMTKATSRITVDAGAAVVARQNVDIRASATDATKVKPKTSSYRDGLVGVTVGTGFTDGVVEVIVGGSITAGQVGVRKPEPLVFNPALAVDFATRTIAFPGDVGFRTGDEVTYSTGGGGAIPGLVDGRTYVAIVDPAQPTRLQLAATAADARAGRAVDFGAGYPTLVTAKGTLPIVSIDADESDTIWFGFGKWPDGSPLFSDGDTVQYRSIAGQFVGRNDAAGRLIGALPDGDYRVEVVPGLTRIRLLDAQGARVNLNTNAQFVTDTGAICQVAAFNADAATVSFADSAGAGSAPAGQPGALANGQRLRYVQAFGPVVPGLVDGRDYYAVVDPAAPGVIRLAESLAQARAADPAVQNAVPTLQTGSSDPLGSRTIAIGDVHPGTGLVFGEDPRLPAGTPVVYRAVPGKPVGGLVDGTTYYAYPLVNPDFEPNFPQYIVGLRATADPSAPLIQYRLFQSLAAGNTDLVINGIDTAAGALALALPQAAPVLSADSSQLAGGTATIASLPAASPQVWTNATGGTFTISIPSGATRAVTAAIPFSASAAAVAQAINAVGIAGVSVTAATGRGRSDSPWTLVGSGLDGLLFDWTGLTGGSVWSKLTRDGLQAVSTTATGGTFMLTLDVAGTRRTTAPVRCNASPEEIRAALDAIPGMLAGRVTGSGTAGDPWLIAPRVQPLRTGDAVVFRDAWGSASPGLVDGQTCYAVVAPPGEQGRDGSVVIRLAATRDAALSPDPVPVPLTTTLQFETPEPHVMLGAEHAIASAVPATGINLAVTLDSADSQAAKSENGSTPGWIDLLTRGDFQFTQAWKWKDLKSGLEKAAAQRIEEKLGTQQANEWVTLSGSGAYFKIANTARVVVQSTASLLTPGSVSITSKVIERVSSSVDAAISKPNAGKLAGAIAVDIVSAAIQSHATVEAGANVTGGGGVAVDAQTVYPWPGEWLGDFAKEEDSFGTVMDDLQHLAENAIGVLGRGGWQNLLFSHFAGAGIKPADELKARDKLAWTVAGSCSWVTLSNDTVARIEDGAKINQVNSASGDLGGLSVTAHTDVTQFGWSGNSYRGVNGRNGLGGSLGYLDIANTTRALLGGLETGADGKPIRSPTGPLLVAAGTDGVRVDAKTDTLIIQLTVGGTNATNFGFSGMASYLDAGSRAQATEAAIEGPVDAARKAVVRSAGSVDVGADDTTHLIPVAGAVVIADSRGVGVSTAIARLDRDVTARLGARDDDADAAVGVVDVLVGSGGPETTKRLRVEASADGAVTPVALAADVVSEAEPFGDLTDLHDLAEVIGSEPFKGAGNDPQGVFGLAVSGDFASAGVVDAVKATVNTKGTIASSSLAATLGVSASNTTTIQAIGGAAAMLRQRGDGSANSLAGSGTLVDADSTVIASVRRATLLTAPGCTLQLAVSARNERSIGNAAASGTGAAQTQSGTTRALAGSVTINTIKTTTTATIDGVTASGLSGVATTADTKDTIWAAAGSFLLNFSPKGGKAAGKSIGVGEAFAYNRVTADTLATVVNSALTLPAGGLDVEAVDASRIFTFAAGLIVTNAGSSLGGMFSLAIVNSTAEAKIETATIDVAAGAVNVLATSALLIVTGAGDLIVGRGQGSVAAGAAVAVVGGSVSSKARIRDGSVRVRNGSLKVKSQTLDPDADPEVESILADVYTPQREQTAIWTFAIGVVWSRSAATASFSVCVNELTTARTASIENSARVTVDAGTVAVGATNEAAIYSAAGAIAWGSGGGGKVAAGAAVVRSGMTETTTALIDKANVTTGGVGGTVEVAATSAGLIGTAAVGGEVAGVAAAGTALVFNTITQTVDARITGDLASPSIVAASGAVTVTATERSRIGTGAGQVSVATKGVAAGAAGAVNAIDSTVDAVIEWATVTSSGGAIVVKADAASEIYSYAVGVAGAFNGEIIQFAGVGSGTGNTLVRRVTAAVRSQAALSSGDLSVTATDASKINTAAGTLAIQYSFEPDVSIAVGISASTNTVGSPTDENKRSFVQALVDDSTITVHGALTVSAKSSLAIQAITAAGAGNFSGGETQSVGIAGAGAGSGNTVQMDVAATVRDSVIAQDSAGGIMITAANTTTVLAVAGGVAVAGATFFNTKGTGVEIGAAAALNTVSLGTTALVAGSTSIQSSGPLTVGATGNGSIKAVGFGVAAALRYGGSTFDLTGAGSASVNKVTTKTRAAIAAESGQSPTIGSAAQPLSAVAVTASDTSSIVAGAGALASIFSFGQGTSLSLSVGVSFTINEVSGTVAADVGGARIRTAGGVGVAAQFTKGQNDRNIQSITVAGAVGATAGGGTLFALAGSGNRNTVNVTTSATISPGADVQAGGGVSVQASDQSVISSNAGGVGLGLTWGAKTGLDVAVGAAYGRNDIANTVRARIEQATVTAGTGVTVSANEQPTIDSVAYGVALAAAVTSSAASAAGSSAWAYNTVADTVEAAILSATVTTSTGDVVVQAGNAPQITTRAGAGSLAVDIGDSAALAPGVVILESSVGDTVTARIGRSDKSTVDPNVTAANGGLTVQATSAASVASVGVAVAASVALGEVTVALSGAGASGKAALGSTITAAIDVGKATAKAVSVLAVDRDAVTQNTVGTGALAIGVVGGSLGVSLTQTTAANAVSARIGGAAGGGTAAVTATGGGITVDVRGGHSLATESVATAVAIALGATGAGGKASTTDTSTYRATVAAGATLRAAGTLLVQARGSSDEASAPDGRLDAQAHGGSAGLVAVGAVIAAATDGTLREATIGDAVDLSGVAALDLLAASSPRVQAESVAVDVGGIAVTVNQSTVTTSGRVSARTGAGVALPAGDVRVIASGTSLLQASQNGVVSGALAGGATQATGASGLATEAVLGAGTRTGAGRSGGLLVRATSQDAGTSIAATSGSGGLFAGFGTTGDLTDTTTTRALILGGEIRAGAVDVAVARRNSYGIAVDSQNITVLAGVGVTRASFTAGQTDSSGDDRVLVRIGPGTKIIAQDRVTVGADHRIVRAVGGSTVSGAGGSVLVSGQQAVSNVTAWVPATIGIEDNVSITSGSSVQTRPGGITLLPTGSLTIDDSTRLSNLGLLVQGGRIVTNLRGNVTPQVRIGNDVTLVSHGQLNVGTTAFVASSTSTNGWGHGLFGGIGSYATSDVTVDQRVSIGDRVTLKSDGSLSLTPGDDPTGGAQTYLALDATARASSVGLVAIPVAKGRSTLAHSSSLSFGTGGNVSSGRSIYLSARAAEPTVNATGRAEAKEVGFIPKTDDDAKATPSTTSTVTLAGTFVAGRENRLGVDISGGASGAAPSIDVTTPDPIFGVPVKSAWTYDPAFNPSAYVKDPKNGFSPEVQAALLSGVATGTVGAVVFNSPDPLLVSGGSVTVMGDTISAAGASITAQVGTISIRNTSPAYLIVGGSLTIANVEGGRVDFKTAAGGQAPDPQGAAISRDGTTPAVGIDLTYDHGVGGSSYGPAVFLRGRLENLGGDVTITDATGSFGQSGTIAAKRITIDTPNGVFAVDTPNDPWNAAGTPAAQVADVIPWPGGNPRQRRPNANQAVMYAINANAGGAWGGRTSDDALNAAVYAQPTDPQGQSFVFFGGSTPQFVNLDTNTEAYNKALSAAARVDQAAVAWRMTDVYNGGAHAWLPALEVLDTDFICSVPRAAGGTAVTGQVIVINARVANINGTIQAGGGTTQTQSVVIDASLQASLGDFQRRYQSGAVAQAIYAIPADQLRTRSPGDRLMSASFDARTGQILLDEATSTGGGSVSIKGRLINTAGVDASGQLLGRIKVQGGSGSIFVQNDTTLPIVTGNLRTSRGEQQAVVSITDLNTDDVAQQQTTYVYDGGQIIVYRGAAGVDLPAVTTPRDHVQGALTRQDPRPNARWQWQEVANMTRSVTISDYVPGQDWPGVIAGNWSFTNPDDPWSTPGGAGAGDVVFESDSSDLTGSMSGELVSEAGPVRPDYSKDNWGIATGHTFWYPSAVSLTMTMSLKADWPIGIDFSGTSFGGITVASVGDVVVGGSMIAATATIGSSGGGIAATSAGFVDAASLTLDAQQGIGNAASPLAIAAERVSAVTTAGDVFLDGRRGDATLMILGNMWAPTGTVSILAPGDVGSIGGSVRGAAARLLSLGGSVGTVTNPLVLEAGPGGSMKVDVSAAGGVNLRQTAGDMLVGTITAAKDGAVQIDVDGNVFNADTWTIDTAAADRRIQAFTALGATDANAYLADVGSFEKNVTGRYFLWWSLRQNAGNLPLWRPRTAAALGIDNPTDDQVRTYVAGLQADLAGFLGTTFGAGWASLPQFVTFDKSYAYVATAGDVARFSTDRTVTAAQLALTMQARALDDPPAGESVSGRVNITAGTLRLVSRRGSVGKNDPPVTVSASDLAAGSLTDSQKRELALAATPGDARRTADGGLTLNVRRPIILAVGGRVDVDGPAGVAVAQKTGDLSVGYVRSKQGLVSVIADGSILNAPTMIDMWGEPIGFERPEDWNRVGDAGQSLTTQGLYIPGYTNKASGTWFGQRVSTGSFRASFIYQASANSNPGDGLAFVLQTAGTGAMGDAGSGLGYRGIAGPKVGFLINIYQPNAPGVAFDQYGTWTGGSFRKVPFPLTDRPVYVTLVYDTTARAMNVTVSDQPQPVATGARSVTYSYSNVDLPGLLGPSAFMGFTSGTGDSVTSQQVTRFAFTSDDPVLAQRVTFSGQTAWATTSSDPGKGGFVLTTPAEGPTFTFPAQPDLAAAAWYPQPVRVSTDFRIAFRYRYDTVQGADPGNGLALVLQNSPDGAAARGVTGSGLGYTGIAGKKVGYLINVYGGDIFSGNEGTRFDTRGSAGGPYNLVDFGKFDGVWIDVVLTYDATAQTLTESLSWKDAGKVNPIRTSTMSNVDLTGLLGGTTALLGFTASSGAAVARQSIQSLDFYSPPAANPDTGPDWQLNGSVQSIVGGVLTIPAAAGAATSSWYSRQVSTAGFEASFTYEPQGATLLDPSAYGIALVLQQSPAGYAAVGGAGGSLGYFGMNGPKVGFLLRVSVPPGGVSPFLQACFDDGSESGSFTPLWLPGGPVTVRVVYDAQARTFTASVTGQGNPPFVKTWSNVDLEALLGSRAIMGITSGTGLVAQQIVSDFVFKDRDGIESLKPVSGTTPTVRLWSTQGSIGASGDEIDVGGRLQADAPRGEIHTNPPPSPAVKLAKVSWTRSDGIPVTNSPVLMVTPASRLHRVVYSTDAGRTWRNSFHAVEGMNDVLVAQVNRRGVRSEPWRFRFVLDTKPPQAPRLSVPDRMSLGTRTGQLRIEGLEARASVQYSVNGRAWSATYTPVEGLNVVRVRQVDRAGNVSTPATVSFVLKTKVAPLTVALLRDTGASASDRVTTDGRLAIGGREAWATTEYSTDGGKTWRKRFTAVLGVNELLVRQKDSLGNVSMPTKFRFTLVPPGRGR